MGSLELTVKVLSYRLEHPGSVVPQRGRTLYSSAFQRFILTEADRWQGTSQEFSAAVRVPSDTVRDSGCDVTAPRSWQNLRSSPP